MTKHILPLLLFPIFLAVAPGLPGQTPLSNWTLEDTVFYSADDLSRPEMAIAGGRAHVAFRQTVPGQGQGRDTQIVLKVFDVAPDGSWTDRTGSLFGADYKLLYGPGDQGLGAYTDHQMVAAPGAFFLSFEANYLQGNSKLKRMVIRRYGPDWSLQGESILFEGANDLGEFKMDDQGLALVNGILYAWVVHVRPDRIPDGFALFGLDPQTFQLVVHDGHGGPLLLKNPLEAPWSGMLDSVGGEFRLLTCPRDPAGPGLWSQNGLVDYRYDAGWNLLGSELEPPLFAPDRPTYATGRARYDGMEAWGWTLVNAASPPTAGAIGQAWVRIADVDGSVDWLLVSGQDATPADDDTRHTEIVFHEGRAFVGYFHVVQPSAVTIRRYGILAPPFLELSEPSPGGILQVRVLAGAPASVRLAFTSRLLSQPRSLGGKGDLWLDLDRVLGEFRFQTGPGGRASLGLQVPAKPSLQGRSLKAQALVQAQGGGNARLTPPAAAVLD